MLIMIIILEIINNKKYKEKERKEKSERQREIERNNIIYKNLLKN